MLRKLFMVTEVGTHPHPLYLIREGGNQQFVLDIAETTYTFGTDIGKASVWTDHSDAETFLMVNETAFAGIEGGVFTIQTVYKWYGE